MAESLATKILFKEFCELLERVRAEKPKKTEKLEAFFQKCRDLIPQLKNENPNANVSLFPVIRLLLPNLDRDREPYLLKEKSLATLYVSIFGLKKNTEQFNQLINYTAPVSSSETNSRDFAERAFNVLKDQLQQRYSNFTIADINAFLDEITVKTDKKRKERTWRNLVTELSSMELKWITRIILKDLRLGIGHKGILESFHSEAGNFYNAQSNLRIVCDELTVPMNFKRSSVKITLFTHFRPMLLERCKFEDVKKLFCGEEKRYFIQTKHDGERSQIHMKNGRFAFFTRRGFNIASKPGYGEFQNSGGFLSREIMSLLKKDVQSVILDGELMGWHKGKKQFGSKGMSFDVKNLGPNSAHQPCFVAFDIILYNEELLIDKPYHERLNFLNRIFEEKEGVLHKSKTDVISSSKDLVTFFNKSLKNDDEGIVLKKYDCTYKPNVREKSGCYKIKAEYSENLIQDIDMVILGGFYGEGTWAGLPNSFLMGIALTPDSQGAKPKLFHPVVAVSTGINHQALRELQNKFEKKWTKSCPSNVVTPKKRNQPDLWIDPRESVVLQLRASEITRNDYYEFGYTLRFPRVVKIRDDKPYHDVCTTSEFSSLIKDKGMIQKLTKRHAKLDDIESAPVTKTPRKSTRTAMSKIDERFLCIHGRDVQVKTRLFQGKQFCVLNGDDDLSKQEAEKLLYENGAQAVVANPMKQCYCLIAGDSNTVKVKNLLYWRNYDILQLDWLRRVIKKENISKPLEFYPWEILGLKVETENKLAELYDDMYDSFTIDADLKSLKRSLEKSNEKISREENNLTTKQIKKLDKQIFNDKISPYSIFRGKVGYFMDEKDVERFRFCFLSGTVTDQISVANYVFVNEILVENFFSNPVYRPKMIKSKWICDCFLQGKLLPTSYYVFS